MRARLRQVLVTTFDDGMPGGGAEGGRTPRRKEDGKRRGGRGPAPGASEGKALDCAGRITPGLGRVRRRLAVTVRALWQAEPGPRP